MNANLLREMIALVLEKIRTEKGVSGKFGEKFNINKFKEIESPSIALTYAEHFLEPIGEGSSRKTFLLSSKYALKIALNKAGVGQNEAEVDVFTNPKTKPVVSKIYASGPNNSWLIADLVKPITNEGEFESMTKVSWRQFQDLMRKGYDQKKVDPSWPEFVKNVLQFAFGNEMMLGDMAGEGKMDHWGKTPDGRAVLLDSGFTREVFKSHYSTPGGKNAQAPVADKTRGKSPPASPTKTKVDARGPTDAEASATKTMPQGKASKTKPSPQNDDLQKTKR